MPGTPPADHRIDPVTLEIWWSRLVAIADEAATTLLRTAFSTIVRESKDFATVLMNREGQSIAESTGGIPAFAGIIPRTVKAMLEEFVPESWCEGDVMITNNPWLATGHLPDMAIVTPIFHQGRLIGFAGSAAHSPDVGGNGTAASRDLYEEGVCIPPMHLYRAGRRNEDMLKLFLNNVRVPGQVLGDLEAQVTANEVCRRRTLEFLADTGLEDLQVLGQAVHAHSERAMRKAIAAIPDGRYESEIRADGIPGQPTRIHCVIEVEGDNLTVDYTGSSAQVAAGINCTMNYTQAYSVYPLKCALDPRTRRNEGSYRPIRIIAPEGSILNARYPAAVSARHLSGHLLCCAIYQAMAPAMPGNVLADSGSAPAMRIRFSGSTQTYAPFAQLLFSSGGMGASLHGDGLSTTMFPTNSGAGSVEAFEAVSPLLVRCKEYREDSGGAGRHRGGLGQRCEVHNLNRSPVQVTLLGDREHHCALGLAGGLAGTSAAALLGKEGKPLNLKSRVSLPPDEMLTLLFAGGGGYGEPAERSRDEIRRDIAHGFVSHAAAKRDYGFDEAADTAQPSTKHKTLT
ncbi:hydantoinase B/oxoprolinase family protein [Variovorax sp. DT-64]|uniref:hydantoinase B/oxoprolinase family protein n=1 Tax=Variovorax sp. DT-64 TaxID=3396160 RepID=UPI003F1B6DD0